MIIFMELEENPTVVQTDKMIWGTNCRTMIIVAVDKDRVVSSAVYATTTTAMKAPLAQRMPRTERKATMNLPPSSPSRGPEGRMVLIIP